MKPANIKVADDGTVKVLDLGRAKALAADDHLTGDDAGRGDSAPIGGRRSGRGADTVVLNWSEDLGRRLPQP